MPSTAPLARYPSTRFLLWRKSERLITATKAPERTVTSIITRKRWNEVTTLIVSRKTSRVFRKTSVKAVKLLDGSRPNGIDRIVKPPRARRYLNGLGMTERGPPWRSRSTKNTARVPMVMIFTIGKVPIGSRSLGRA
jgi:hypothetical protein